jgi:hypothetical protein
MAKLDESEEKREGKWALMQRAPRHVVRVNGGPCTTKIILF